MFAVAVLALTACSGSGDDAATSGSANVATVAITPTLVPVVNQLAVAFQSANPSMRIQTRADITVSGLATALQGQTAQVVVAPTRMTAGKTVKTLNGSDKLDRFFGRNRVVIAVPAGNPGRVAGPEAFGANSPRMLVCGGPSLTPVFLRFVLTRAGVQPNPAAINNDPLCPTLAMEALAAGRLDAVLMFRANVTVPPSVRLIDVPSDQNVNFDIGIAKVGSSTAADRFVDFLGSDQAKDLLTRNGYRP